MTTAPPERVSDERLAQLLLFYDKEERELFLVEEDAADCVAALRELLASRAEVEKLRAAATAAYNMVSNARFEKYSGPLLYEALDTLQAALTVRGDK